MDIHASDVTVNGASNTLPVGATGAQGRRIRIPRGEETVKNASVGGVELLEGGNFTRIEKSHGLGDEADHQGRKHEKSESGRLHHARANETRGLRSADCVGETAKRVCEVELKLGPTALFFPLSWSIRRSRSHFSLPLS